MVGCSLVSCIGSTPNLFASVIFPLSLLRRAPPLLCSAKPLAGEPLPLHRDVGAFFVVPELDRLPLLVAAREEHRPFPKAVDVLQGLFGVLPVQDRVFLVVGQAEDPLS